MKKIILDLFLLFTLTSLLGAATIVVDLAGGGNFTNIHDAVDFASDHDTVLVMSGTFIISAADGGITIDKILHMLGSGYDAPDNGGTYIQSATAVFDFTSNADGSSMRGFRIYGYGAPMISISADDMIIEENHLTNSYNQGYLIQLNSGVSADTLRNNILGFNSQNYRPGISVYQTTDVTITNNIFFNFSWYGGVNPSSTTNTLITNNIFLSCAYGIRYNDSGSIIVNNIFMNGTGQQIYGDGGSPSISYNCFHNNSNNGVVGIAPILDDPEFENFGDSDAYTYLSYDDENYDFHLQAGSPCIDGGNPLFDYFDLDGSRNDLGVYGWLFPIGTTGAPTIPVVNSISVTPSTVSPSGTITINASGRIGE